MQTELFNRRRPDGANNLGGAQLVSIVLLSLLHVPLYAADITWGPFSGSFDDPSDWIGGVVPGASDVAIFDGIGCCGPTEVRFSLQHSTEKALFRHGDFVFDLAGRTYALISFDLGEMTRSLTVGENPGDDTSLRISDGTVNAIDVVIGLRAASSGTLNLANGAALNLIYGALDVGRLGDGTLTIESGSMANVSGGSVQVGRGLTGAGGFVPGGQGTINVTGANAKLAVGPGSVVTVGKMIDGTLNVTSGGFVDSNGFFFSVGEGIGTGRVLVQGTDSRLRSIANIDIGRGGVGELRIEDGGLVEALDNVTIGSRFVPSPNDPSMSIPARGDVVVTGDLSRLEVALSLTVGSRRTGTLKIEEGGKVVSHTGGIGRAIPQITVPNLPPENRLTITGSGSEWMNSTDLIVGNATIEITAGGALSSGMATVSEDPTHSSTIMVGGGVGASVWNNTGDLNIAGSASGAGGTAALTVLQGGTVDSTGALRIWDEGSVDASAGGRITAGATTITGGGKLMAVETNISASDQARFDGHAVLDSAVVTGLGSQLINTNDLFILDVTGASLLIEDRGVVTNRTGGIGLEVNSTGTVTVTGSGSQWNNGLDLKIGREGTGVLNVADDASVTVGRRLQIVAGNTLNFTGGTIHTESFDNQGTFNFQNGMLTIDDGTYTGGPNLIVSGHGAPVWKLINGARATIDGHMLVGASQNGEMQILSESIAESTAFASIGQQGSATGSVKVDGTNSQWIVGNALTVGPQGTGSLTIDNGGLVLSASAFNSIGYSLGLGPEQLPGTGTVTVKGPISRWETGLLGVGGYSGSATLAIMSGGTVMTHMDARIDGQSGTVTVNGTGSRWEIAGDLTVGIEGTGVLNVEADGEVIVGTPESLGDMAVGSKRTATGHANVTGDSSVLDVTRNLSVGVLGAGFLDVNSQGQVRTSALSIGSGVGGIVSPDGTSENFRGTGVVTVSGSDTGLNASDTITVGAAGDGTLTIEAGAEVSSGAAQIAVHDDSNGTATVTGAGSKWGNANDLHVGLEGSGRLNVEAGGHVEVGGLLELGSNGWLKLDGGTIKTHSFDATDGNFQFSEGTLTVDGGSFVPAGAFIAASAIGDPTINLQAVRPITLELINGATAQGIVDVSIGRSATLILGGPDDALAPAAPVTSLESTGTVIIDSHNGMAEVMLGQNSSWNHVGGTFIVGQSGNGRLSTAGQGLLPRTLNTEVAAVGLLPGSVGEVYLAGNATRWTTSELYVGGSETERGGTGTVVLGPFPFNAALEVNGLLKVWQDGKVSLNTGGHHANDIDSYGAFEVFHAGLTVDGLFTIREEAKTTFGLASVEADIELYGTLEVQGSDITGAFLGRAGSELNVGDPGLAQVVHEIGDPTRVDGFSTDGNILVLDGELRLNSLFNFAKLGVINRLDNGIISANTGVFLEGSRTIIGTGAVNTRIAAALGSTIVAQGQLDLGDENAFDGFRSDGVLLVQDQTVTLHDADEAVLGSFTKIGDDFGAAGTLIAPNGLLVNFGNTLSGIGTVEGDILNNGLIDGSDDIFNPLVLAGLVSGVGDFSGWVQFSGGFSPGLSPTITDGEGFIFDANSDKPATIELGGLIPGAEHDQINVTDGVVAGGILDIVLINSWKPRLGDVYTLILAERIFSFGPNNSFVEPAFAAVRFPELEDGLKFLLDFNLDPNGRDSLVLRVAAVPLPGALWLLIPGLVVLVRQRRGV